MLITGQCQAGFHEGKKPKDWRGNPVQSCLLWEQCPCSCHEGITQMYLMADMPRFPVENPEYVKPESQFYMPIFGLDYGTVQSLSLDLVSTPLELERTDDDDARPYADTPSGRAAPGSLEAQVLEVCTDYMRNPPEDSLCTPQWVSDQIVKRLHIPPPSTGAINSVFVRWTLWEFAIIGKKPTRFMLFTPDGANHGPEYMKAQYKRKTKARV